MTDQEALQLFKCLADRSRLQILKSLAIEDMDVERLADRLPDQAAQVCRAAADEIRDCLLEAD